MLDASGHSLELLGEEVGLSRGIRPSPGNAVVGERSARVPVPLRWRSQASSLARYPQNGRSTGGMSSPEQGKPVGASGLEEEVAHSQIRILSVDDHPLLREGIATVIDYERDMQLVAEASTGREGIERFRKLQPDITLMDLRLPDMSGVDALTAIREEFPAARIIVLTTFASEAEVRGALAAGARAYILKNLAPRELAETIRQVHVGMKRISPEVAAHLAEHFYNEALTPRELEVLQLVAEGRSNKAIAQRLHISQETVKDHVKHFIEKLGASNRTQAVAIAARRGIICF